MKEQNKAGNIFRNIKNNKYFELLPDFKKEKTQRFTSIVLSLVALSFFGLFAINPTLSTIAKLKKQLADSKYVDQKLEEKINNLSVLQKKYNLIQSDLPIVLASIPKNPEVPTLLAQLQSIAKNSNIILTNLQSFQVEAEPPSTDQSKYSSFSFSISGQGSYEDITKFLSSLTKMQRVLSIDTLSINKKSSETEQGLLQFNILGKAYFKK